MEPLTGLLNWMLYELGRSNLTRLALLCCPEVFTSCVVTALGIGKQRWTVQGWGERPPAEVWVRAAMKQLPPGNHLLNEGETWDWISHDLCLHLAIQDWGNQDLLLISVPKGTKRSMQGSTGQGLALQLTMVSFHDNVFCLQCEASTMWEKPFVEFLFLYLCAWTVVNAESKRAKVIRGLSPQRDICAIPPIHEALGHREASLSLGGRGQSSISWTGLLDLCNHSRRACLHNVKMVERGEGNGLKSLHP